MHEGCVPHDTENIPCFEILIVIRKYFYKKWKNSDGSSLPNGEIRNGTIDESHISSLSLGLLFSPSHLFGVLVSFQLCRQLNIRHSFENNAGNFNYKECILAVMQIVIVCFHLATGIVWNVYHHQRAWLPSL